jgi:hypothetical protein
VAPVTTQTLPFILWCNKILSEDVYERASALAAVMIDSDASYWNALHIKYWPTFCLIGRDGRLYASVPGEMDAGDAGASKVKEAIELLLKRPAS